MTDESMVAEVFLLGKNFPLFTEIHQLKKQQSDSSAQISPRAPSHIFSDNSKLLSAAFSFQMNAGSVDNL